MHALLKPEYYRSALQYQTELSSIFSGLWIFACLRQDIAGRSHYGIRIGNKDVIIQLDEEHHPRAFLNSCSHRGSLLCNEGKNAGFIRCPYHGWSYNLSGIPMGIPAKENFPEVVSAPENFKLNEVLCEAAGDFIFVSLNLSAPTLKEYLDKEYDFMVQISQGIDQPCNEFTQTVPANWKVVIENALEGYHVPSVHQKTFLVAEGMGKRSSDPVNIFANPLHSSMNHSADAEWLKKLNIKIQKKIGTWPFMFDYYTHHHIFPNLTITSFLGYSFHIQIFKPVDEKSTSVHSRTATVKFSDQTPVGQKYIEKIYADSHEFTLSVFNEDLDICEKVQKGLNNASHEFILGNILEQRIHHFQKAYMSTVI